MRSPSETDRIRGNCTWTRKRRIGERKYQADGKRNRRGREEGGCKRVSILSNLIGQSWQSLAQGTTPCSDRYMFCSDRFVPILNDAMRHWDRDDTQGPSRPLFHCSHGNVRCPAKYLRIFLSRQAESFQTRVCSWNFSTFPRTRSSDVNFLVRFYDWEYSSLWILMIFAIDYNSHELPTILLWHYDKSNWDKFFSNSFLSRQKVSTIYIWLYWSLNIIVI